MFPQSEIFYPTLTPPQTTEDGMMGRRLDQQQVQEESLVAVLIIQDSNRQEQWLNCGALVYDLRMPDTNPKPHHALIGTMTTETEDCCGFESLRGYGSQQGRDENEDDGPR